MSPVEASTLRRPDIAFDTPTVTALAAAQYPIDLLGDQTTWLYRYTGNQVGVSANDGTSVTAGKAFYDATWTFRGGVEVSDTKFLASVSKVGLPGELWLGTGWSRATGQATTWTKVLTCGGIDTYIRPEWGVSIAPSWSKHAGAIFVTEYGTLRTDDYADPDMAATRSYVSTDGGASFVANFNVRRCWPTDTHLHCHSSAYDPWAGRLYIAQGDQSGTATLGKTGIWYSDNPTEQNPTFKLVPGSSGTPTAGTNQVTTMFATEAGIVCLGDSGRPGIWLLPRVSGGIGIGPMRQRVLDSGQAAAGIGGTLYRNGKLENPQAGAPLIAAFQAFGTVGQKAALWVSRDGGVSWFEGYRHATAISVLASTGVERAFGPALNGTVLGSIKLAGTFELLKLAHAAVATPTKQSPTKFPHRIFSGRHRADATTQLDTTLNEVGVAALAGGSGSLAMFDLDPLEHDRLRLELSVSTNGVAPGCDFSLTLYPVTGTSGAATNVTPALGTAVVTVSVLAPALNTVVAAAFTDVQCPAAGRYLIKANTSTTLTASSSVQIRGTLKGRAA